MSELGTTERLVSVGIPTYNRSASLGRAVMSVLAHPRLELIIADNGSTDDTPVLCRKWAENDARVRVERSEVNLGPTENFNRVRALAAGDCFMWLGDDDWIDPNYVSACVAELDRDPGVALAAGVVRYHDAAGDTWLGRRVETVHPDPVHRVLDLYGLVKDNGTFYGVAARAVLVGVPPMENAMGNDVQHVAALAFQGSLRVVVGTTVHRATGGATASLKRAARSAGMPWWQGEFPPLAMAWFAFRDVAWHSPIYASLSPPVRIITGLRAASILVRRFVPQAVPKYRRVIQKRIFSIASGSRQHSSNRPSRRA
jgi:hypothetical protein